MAMSPSTASRWVPSGGGDILKLAAQLFSNTMSTAIKYCGEKKIIKNNHWEQAVDLFKTINDWFDLLNTQLPIDGFTKSYGLDLD
ncbi:Uncharacterized protein FWK35_00022926, partial [Aphis craccivora]